MLLSTQFLHSCLHHHLLLFVTVQNSAKFEESFWIALSTAQTQIFATECWTTFMEKSTRACPKRPRRIRLAVHFACGHWPLGWPLGCPLCMQSGSLAKFVHNACGIHALLRRAHPSPPPMVVSMNGREKQSDIKVDCEQYA